MSSETGVWHASVAILAVLVAIAVPFGLVFVALLTGAIGGPGRWTDPWMLLTRGIGIAGTAIMARQAYYFVRAIRHRRSGLVVTDQRVTSWLVWGKPLAVDRSDIASVVFLDRFPPQLRLRTVGGRTYQVELWALTGDRSDAARALGVDPREGFR